MHRHRVLVLYNEPVLPMDHPDYASEVEVLDNVAAVSQALAEADFEVARLGVGTDPQALLAGVRAAAPDAVLNLYEGSGNNSASELYAAGLLEWLGVPLTGCPLAALVLARSKHLAKAIFLADGLPTAPYFVVDQTPVARSPLAYPVMVKPAQQDASVGIDQRSVATDLESLNARVTWLLEQFGPPVLVEEFIPGRELTLALVEMPDLRLLPGTEVVFPDNGPGYWPILSYDAKWSHDSVEYQTSRYHFKAQLSADLAEKVAHYARRAFRLLGARDYARVDFRIRHTDHQPFLLEVNPNPDFAPDQALANNLEAAGISHADFAVQLVRNALARGKTATQQRYLERKRLNY